MSLPTKDVSELTKDDLLSLAREQAVQLGALRAALAAAEARAERLAAYAFCADTLRRCSDGGLAQMVWSRRYEHAKAALQPGDLGEEGAE